MSTRFFFYKIYLEVVFDLLARNLGGHYCQSSRLLSQAEIAEWKKKKKKNIGRSVTHLEQNATKEL